MHRRGALTRIGFLGAFAAPAGLQEIVSRAAGHGDTAPLSRNATDEDFQRLLRLANVPSFSLAEVAGDRISTASVGVRRSGEPQVVTPDTVYAAASLTKAVFAYALIALARDGAFSLDRPVADYLPLPNPEDERAKSITARHLLSHSGGWRNWRFSADQALTADFTPGERWSYSGEGYFFLQRLAEHLTGRAVGDIVRERVFEPLGMTRSSMAPLESLEENQAASHSAQGEPRTRFGEPTIAELRRMVSSANRSLESVTISEVEQALRTVEPKLAVLPVFFTVNAAATMLTTANDFARFLRHIVTARRAGGAAAAIVTEMTTTGVRCNEAIRWGHGAGLETLGDTTWAWQWGDNPGFKNIYFADPGGERALVIFTNGDRGARVYERVVRARTGLDHPAFLFA
ncbi:MAG: serine hydrolase domain-containing protein [Gemmatimonadaceae bacterium]